MSDVHSVSWFGADNYDDCVLEALKNSGNNNLAIRLAEKACRNKFPDSAPKPAAPPPSPPKPEKVKCGDYYIDPDSTAYNGILFKNPFGQFETDVKKIVVEFTGFQDELVVYLSHSWPFPIDGIRLSSRKTKNSDGPADWVYECYGSLSPDVTGSFKCGKPQTEDDWLRVDAIKSVPGNELAIMRAAKKC